MGLGRHLLIVNPRAASGRAVEAAWRAERLYRDAAIPVAVHRTAGPGDAHARAARAAAEFEAVVALGGDGTMHEVANGLADAAREAGGPDRVAALGVLPSGTGNDFLKTLEVGAGLEAAFATVRAGRRRRIDLGLARGALRGRAGRFEREWFANDFSVGFGAAVVHDMAERPFHLRYLTGFLAYMVSGFLRALMPPFEAALEIDGVARRGRYLEVHVGNGRFCGGGIQYTPRARLDDGILDVTLLERMSAVRFILTNLGPVKKGTLEHAPRRGVVMTRATRFAIEQERGFPLYLDGEPRHADPSAGGRARVEIEVVPAALDVLAPAP